MTRKRKIKRKQIPPSVLAADKRMVLQFAAECLRKCPNSRTPTWQMFESFKRYAERNNHRVSISIDGFGRLLPKHIKRKLINFDGYICNGAPDYVVVYR